VEQVVPTPKEHTEATPWQLGPHRHLNLFDVGRAAGASYAMGDGQRARDLNLFDVGRAAGASYAPQSSCYEAQ
jgi:hypothetical protein